MILEHQVEALIGTTAFDTNGDKIGKVGQVYLDDATGRPEWLTINTGLFGLKETFVPTQRAEVRDGGVVVPYEKGEVKNAPNVDVEAGHLSPTEEAELYRYYNMEYGEPTATGTDLGPNTVTRTSAGTVTDFGGDDTGSAVRGTTYDSTSARLRRYHADGYVGQHEMVEPEPTRPDGLDPGVR